MNNQEVFESRRNARLTLHGPRLLVHRFRDEGAPVAHVAKSTGLSRQCAHRRVARFDAERRTKPTDDLVALDNFYIGRLEGVGKAYQLNTVDTYTRSAIKEIIVGPVTATDTIEFIDHLPKIMRRLGIRYQMVLTDDGPDQPGEHEADDPTVLEPASTTGLYVGSMSLLSGPS